MASEKIKMESNTLVESDESKMESDIVLFEVVLGTYEKFLYGYYLVMNSDHTFTLKPSFSTEAHLQSVKCIASSNKFLASGSSDETIQLFNMKTRLELGSLMLDGTVTALAFHDSFLFSCSDDGTICIWSTKNWECLKTLLSHNKVLTTNKKAVNSITIHPSGKMAMSVSKDKTLRTWNLIKGRSAYVKTLQTVAESVRFSPEGSRFLVSYNDTIDVYEIENASISCTIKFQQKICDFTFINEDTIAVGGETENIQFYDLKSGNMKSEFKAHSSRVKALQCVNAGDETFLVSTSSDGSIKVWHVDVSEEELKPRKIAKRSIEARPTCMTVLIH